MYNGMKLKIDAIYVSKLEIHAAAKPAFECFMAILWEFVFDFIVETKMRSRSPIIMARPLVIADKDGNNKLIMHFGMYDELLQDLDLQEAEQLSDDEDFEEKKYTVFRVQSKLPDEQIELISWLYNIDIFDGHTYCDGMYELLIDFLKDERPELIADIIKSRPNSDFVRLWKDWQELLLDDE